MMPLRPVLLVGGAPRVKVDAIRHLTVEASGSTVAELHRRLDGVGCCRLLSLDARPEAERRFATRADLERELATWITAQPEGVVVLSAAINDYRVADTRIRNGDAWSEVAWDGKLPSGGDEVLIRLVPDSKIIDRLRPQMGLRGPLVAFKYQAADTLIAAARALQARTRADLMVANSLCGTVQALIDRKGGEVRFPTRTALLDALAQRIRTLAQEPVTGGL